MSPKLDPSQPQLDHAVKLHMQAMTDKHSSCSIFPPASIPI